MLDDAGKTRIMSLAEDFPKLWRDPATPDRERKRMIRLLVEDVTLINGDQITAHVRLRGGATRTLRLSRPLTAWQARQTSPEVVAQIDRLLDEGTDAEVAGRLNELGLRSGTGGPFTPHKVARIRTAYALKTRYHRLREAGMLTSVEIAKELGAGTDTVKRWQARGVLRAHPYNDKNECLYERPDEHTPVKMQGVNLSDPRRFTRRCLQSIG